MKDACDDDDDDDAKVTRYVSQLNYLSKTVLTSTRKIELGRQRCILLAGTSRTLSILIPFSFASIVALDKLSNPLFTHNRHGYLSAIRLLLDLGANPLIKDFGGLQPKNAYHGDEGVRYILEKKIEELQLKQQ